MSRAASEAFSNAPEKMNWATVDPAIKEWLLSNREALELFRLGSECTEAQEVDFAMATPWSILPPVGESRDLMRLCQLEGARLESEGNFVEAMHAYRALLRAGQHFGQRGGEIEWVVGNAMFGGARDALVDWSTHSEVDADLLQQVLQELAGARRIVRLPSDMFKVEHAVNDRDLKTGGTNLAHLVDRHDFGLDWLPEKLVPFMLWVMGVPEMSQRVRNLACANQLSRCDQFPSSWGNFSRQGYFEPEPGNNGPPAMISVKELESLADRAILSQRFLIRVAFLRSQRQHVAGEQALTATLALQIYHHRYGHFPEKLSELVAEELPGPPLDPYGNHGALLNYRRDGENALVWSIGSDGIDDLGMVDWNYGQKRGDYLFRVVKPYSRTQPNDNEE